MYDAYLSVYLADLSLFLLFILLACPKCSTYVADGYVRHWRSCIHVTTVWMTV